MVHKAKKTFQCPQTLSLLRVGSGNETINKGVCSCIDIVCMQSSKVKAQLAIQSPKPSKLKGIVSRYKHS